MVALRSERIIAGSGIALSALLKDRGCDREWVTNISQKQEIGWAWAGDDMSTTSFGFLRRGKAIYLAVWRGVV